MGEQGTRLIISVIELMDICLLQNIIIIIAVLNWLCCGALLGLGEPAAGGCPYGVGGTQPVSGAGARL